MKKINWCLKQSHGLRLIEPNLGIAVEDDAEMTPRVNFTEGVKDE